MFRKMYQGGSSRKQEPRLAMRDADEESPRDAGFQKFNAYLRNADLVSFEEEKCRQYHYLTSSFVRRFEFSSSRNSPYILFDRYEKSYTMDLEDFTTACKLPQWGSASEPRKS